MEELTREQLERMVDVMSTLLLRSIGDAGFLIGLLRDEGLETEELQAAGFDVEVE